MSYSKKKVSSLELVNKGWLLVNVPSISIILVVWYCLAAYLGINGKVSVFIGGVLGWIYWEFTVKKWIKWALDNNVEPDRLLRIGKLSLLLWNSRQIDEVLSKKK